MANTEPKDMNFLPELDKVYDSRLRNSLSLDGTYKSDATWFKSFDFSNVAIYAKNPTMSKNPSSYLEKEDNPFFRRFHQMTIYVKNPRVFTHGNDGMKKGDWLVITSNLPESFSYSFGGEWVTPFKFGNPTLNAIMQVAGIQNVSSGVSRATTLRVWDGSKPLSLNLTIPVIDDGESSSGTNLIEALEMLGSLALPSYNYNRTGTYLPPPSPFSFTIKYDKKGESTINEETGKEEYSTTEEETTKGSNLSRVMLQLGGMLLIDHCIIENVDVKYPNTKTMIRHDYTKQNENFGNTGGFYLHPLLAEVTLKISTAEALTANNYSKMLWAKKGQTAGNVNVDLTGMSWVTEGVAAAENKAKNV